MNSQVVSKEIRSRVWPVLRKQGFTRFEQRRAWRDRGPLIDAVGFPAVGVTKTAVWLDQTPHSFIVEFGVHVRGSMNERWMKKDAAGRLRPDVEQCAFQGGIEKGSAPKSGLQGSLFSLDSSEERLNEVFDHLVEIFENGALDWFDDYRTLETALSNLDRITAGPGSIVWLDLHLSLLLAQRDEDPKSAPPSQIDALVDALAGGLFSTLAPGLFYRHYVEAGISRLRELLIRAGRSTPESLPRVFPAQCELLGANWDTDPGDSEPIHEDSAAEAWRLMKQPLKELGFVITSRWAATRQGSGAIDIVSLEPKLPAWRGKLPKGLFAIGLGVSKSDFQRPSLRECPLQVWLMPERRIAAGPTVFADPPSAVDALRDQGLKWFTLVHHPDFAKFLKRPASEWVIRYPTMRAFGAFRSQPGS